MTTYHCIQHRAPVTLDDCRDCYARNVTAGDALAKLWVKHWPTRLLCKQRNIADNPVNENNKK